MTVAVFFVVERTPSGEMPVLYYGTLTVEKRKQIYALRLDVLPDADRWAAMSLAQLYDRYVKLRDAGKLPTPNLAGPPKKTAPTTLKLGERWEFKPTWDRSAPFVRPPVGPPRLDAPAFIGAEHSSTSPEDRGVYVGLNRQ